MKLPVSFRLAFWIVLVWGLFAALAHYTDFPALHWFPLAVLGIGIFLFRERPLGGMGFPPAFETSLVLACAFVFMAYAGWTVMGPRLEAERIAQLPCAPQSLESQCYTFSRDNCSTLWTHFENDCKSEAKRALAGKPNSRLTGPIVRKCTYKKMDQSFKSNRKTPVNQACQSLFSSLDSHSFD